VCGVLGLGDEQTGGESPGAFLVKSRRVAPGNLGAYVWPLSSSPTWIQVA
jgi:hypothetical protein